MGLEEEFHTQLDVTWAPSTANLAIAHLGAWLPESYTGAASRIDVFPLRMVEAIKGVKADLQR
jgi:hypothetical protein